MAEWYRPASLSEALEIRAREEVAPIAGATDLYVRHRRGAGMLPAIEHPLLSIAHLDELRGITSDGILTIGAATTYSEILHDTRVPKLLRQACAELAAPALRNVATIGGNICNASPAADAVCPLYVLDAACELRSATSNRTLPIEAFITGPGKTALARDELLVAVRIPLPVPSAGETERTFYRKVGTRRANALTKVSMAARAAINADRSLSRVAIALGAVGPTILRSREIEARMRGPASDLRGNLASILDAYRAFVSPIDDQRSSAAYRREVAANLVRQFVDEVVSV
jgi:CO/xanthine dehydrogenase FAD-binding subunit